MGKNKEIGPNLDKMMKRLSKTAGQPRAILSGTAENPIQNMLQAASEDLSQSTPETYIQDATGKDPTAIPLKLTGSTPKTAREIARDALLKKVHAIIESEIRVQPREWTGPGRKGMNDLKRITGKLPTDLVEEIEALDELKTHAMEKALRLYLMVIKAAKETEWGR